jgi:hypothetical protein
MLENYKLILQKTFLLENKKLLLATSGGLDMVMAQLFAIILITYSSTLQFSIEVLKVLKIKNL